MSDLQTAMAQIHRQDEEITSLRAQLGQAEGRVAELESQNEALRQQLQQFMTSELKTAVDYAQSLILRKQAEAVEAFAEWAGPHWPQSQAIMIKDDARSHAFELRQQADELEQKQ